MGTRLTIIKLAQGVSAVMTVCRRKTQRGKWIGGSVHNNTYTVKISR